jgi:signal transduction histidine kinase
LKGDWKKALAYYEKYKGYTDSLNLLNARGQLFEVNQKYSVAQKEADIKELENKNLKETQLKQRIITIAIIGISLLLMIVFALYVNNKKQQAKRATERQNLLDNLQSMEREMDLNRLQQQAEQEAAITAQRKSISQNMHDEVNSSLAALRFFITDIKQNMSEDGKVPVSVLDDLEEEARVVYQQSRSFMHHLNSASVNETYNVIELIKNLSVRFGNNSNLAIYSHIESGIELYLNSHQHSEMYRIVKEAVANSMKHSGANIINISLTHKANMIYFEIADNGKGIKEDKENGIGIEAMKHRIDSLQGQINISSTSQGTIIKGSFPC